MWNNFCSIPRSRFGERYLSVRLSASLIGFAEVKTQSVAVFLVQALHNVEGAFAQSLTHGVEEDQNQVTEISCGHHSKIII